MCGAILMRFFLDRLFCKLFPVHSENDITTRFEASCIACFPHELLKNANASEGVLNAYLNDFRVYLCVQFFCAECRNLPKIFLLPWLDRHINDAICQIRAIYTKLIFLSPDTQDNKEYPHLLKEAKIKGDLFLKQFI
ncbi:hypothetical protein METH_08645 [Leisingera methylohalidivorans DSM 14336]|uniref:Uncharacterized protein n=1 Tax=Leisingera methylohalidivorans DSM 14336 TaxID=999552 RepID=V9VW74_9RHOB|nr:hypothetical protein METH_08645 [Leisingera methylohalidivorans DSM 14336]